MFLVENQKGMDTSEPKLLYTGFLHSVKLSG